MARRWQQGSPSSAAQPDLASDGAAQPSSLPGGAEQPSFTQLSDDTFNLFLTGWPTAPGPPLRLGDLLPEGGRRLQDYDADWEYPQGLVDIVPPTDLGLYVVLASRRPVGRSHLAAREDRERCILLAAAFFLDVRRSQIELFTEQGLRHALTPPCSRCGLPTGSWCDVCGRPLCRDCDDEGATPCCMACGETAGRGTP